MYNSTLEVAKKQIELNIYSDSTDYDKDINEFVAEIGRKFAKARIEKAINKYMSNKLNKIEEIEKTGLVQTY